MEKETKEKIKLTVREILLTFYDGINVLEEIFAKYSWQKEELREYWKWRELDKERFYHALWQLEKQGYIRRHKESKNSLIKLTKIGKEKAIQYALKEWQIKKPKKWDKKWRVIIFDIPNEKKVLRDIVRRRLKYWGFHQLQKSVFVYPFDCQKEISALKNAYGLGSYLQFIIADSIETELDLVNIFFEKEVLTKNL